MGLMSQLNPFAPPADRAAPRTHAPPPEPPQSVRFCLTEADLIAGALYANQHSPEIRAMVRRRQRQQVVVGLAMLLAGGTLFVSGAAAIVRALAFGAMLGGVVLLTSAALLRLRAGAMVRARARAYVRSGVVQLSDEKTELTLAHSGVTISEPYLTTHVEWPRISRVRSTPDHLFLFASPAAPYVAPAAAFLSEDAFHGFCRLAERLWEEHHQPPEAHAAGPA